VVGKGEHVVAVYKDEYGVDSNTLEISSAMNIVGDPGVLKSEIVVVGGILFKKGIQLNCHLQHMMIRHPNGSGVWGVSSFTMEDVIVEQCKSWGVGASGRFVVGRCTNVEVRQCGHSGIFTKDNASITLIGAKTTVHHNCTEGHSYEYGLRVCGCFVSTIQLVAPLTKEQVAIDNGGGGNWGFESSHIITINTLASSANATVAGETKTNLAGPKRDVEQSDIISSSDTTTSSESSTLSEEPIREAFLFHLLHESYKKVFRTTSKTNHPHLLDWIYSKSIRCSQEPTLNDVLVDVFKTMPYTEAVMQEFYHLMQEQADMYEIVLDVKKKWRNMKDPSTISEAV
jgi:hypothetical protein